MTVKYSGVQINEQCIKVRALLSIQVHKYKIFDKDCTDENAVEFAHAYQNWKREFDVYMKMIK